MAKKQANPKPEPRKPRADAERNRERILLAARDAFTRHGVDVSLDDVARQADVGPGTLYRHFPNRDALVEAVYRSELEKLAKAAEQFTKALPPVEALRAWMKMSVDYIETKQLIAPALNNIVGGPKRIYDQTGPVVTDTMNRLVASAVQSGDIRPDLDPIDLLRALVGVSNVASAPNWADSAKRLVDILILGSKPQ